MVYLTEQIIDDLEISSTRVKSCRVELNFPENDWGNTWPLVRTKGLESNCVTFVWRMIHDILPTRERVHHLHMPNINSPDCNNCNTPESVQHYLALCPESNTVFLWLLKSLQKLCQDITREKIFFLDFPHLNEFPLVWLTAHVLEKIWSIRQMGKRVHLFQVRAEIESRINLLRKSRYGDAANLIQMMIS